MPNRSITSITVSSGVASVTLASANAGLVATDWICIAGATNSGTAPVSLLNGPQNIVTRPDTTHFTINLPTDQGTWGTIGGTMTEKDYSRDAVYYATFTQQAYANSYIMAMPFDSTAFAAETPNGAATKARAMLQASDAYIDIWEIGNELNGGWLGTDATVPSASALSNTIQKCLNIYDAVKAYSTRTSPRALTAICFFYEGEPASANNCIDTTNNGNSMFTWIDYQFQMGVAAGSRNAGSERIRLGVDYVLVSWYPYGCSSYANQNQADWNWIFAQLKTRFPQARVGFGELGTATVAGFTEARNEELVNKYYPLHQTVAMPDGYCLGGYWWYAGQQIVPGAANYATYSALGPLIGGYANADPPLYWLPA